MEERREVTFPAKQNGEMADAGNIAIRKRYFAVWQPKHWCSTYFWMNNGRRNKSKIVWIKKTILPKRVSQQYIVEFTLGFLSQPSSPKDSAVWPESRVSTEKRVTKMEPTKREKRSVILLNCVQKKCPTAVWSGIWKMIQWYRQNDGLFISKLASIISEKYNMCNSSINNVCQLEKWWVKNKFCGLKIWTKPLWWK